MTDFIVTWVAVVFMAGWFYAILFLLNERKEIKSWLDYLRNNQNLYAAQIATLFKENSYHIKRGTEIEKRLEMAKQELEFIHKTMRR